MTRVSRLLLNCAARVLAILLAAGIAMLLVRYGPGFESEERDLDPTVSASTRTAIHTRLLSLDFSESRALGRPVRELIAERGPATLRILVFGSAMAWIVALPWAIALTVFRVPALAGLSSLISACLLCLPTAAIAALMLNADWPAEMVLALALAPRIFQVVRGLIMQAVQHGEVLAARARGLRPLRILGWYVLPQITGPMLAWLVATTGLAIAAIVPIEVICDVPGLGQLAWKAALARDLPLLVVLTVLVAIVIQLSNAAGGAAAAMVSKSLGGQRA